MADYTFNRATTELPTTAERPAAGLAPLVSNPLRGRKRLLLIGGGLALVFVVVWGLTAKPWSAQQACAGEISCVPCGSTASPKPFKPGRLPHRAFRYRA